MPLIREIVGADHEAVLALNNAAVPAVNGHDPDSLRDLMALANGAWVADDGGELAGLLVGFSPDAAYQSLNYRWLSARYDDFGYVDRVVVAPSHRRRGIGAGLYRIFADHARAQGLRRLVCEVNVEPPNPTSMAFHRAGGWRPITDVQHAPGRVVRFFERPL